MNILLLLIFSFTTPIQNIFTKQYDSKATVPNPFLFTGVSAATTWVILLLIAGFKVQFVPELIPHALGYAITILLGCVFIELGMSVGPISLTSLISSYSTIIPIAYGIVWLREPVRKTAYIGFVLLLISLYLINKKQEEEKALNVRWIIYAVLMFFMCGINSVVAKVQQMDFNNAYRNEFLIYSFGLVTCVILPLTLIREKNRLRALKECAPCGVGRGIVNSAYNMLSLILLGRIPSALLFSLNSAIGITFMFVVSQVFYKEKMSRPQIIGYVLGGLSIIFFNLS